MCHTLSETNPYHPTHIMKAQVRLAALAERRGCFETFGWTMWAAGFDSELLSLGGQLDHSDLGLQLEESTSRFQCKKTDSEAAGHHKTTGPILRTCSAEQAATTAGD